MTHYLSDHQNRKAKIFLIAGFLGSGKTTLLKRILSWETDLSDTVVLVNEFGKVGIDGSLWNLNISICALHCEYSLQTG